ncbi:MAG: LacI family DNA-binding transcriptional regulator [Kiritimatiellae bacterium]|jgi:LacI family transcriptional regulator|nr:LacI family DNA-binding transcriptional regulator [Kiritimatiellia bacterium]
MNNSIRLQEVAEAAGVSTMTVSRVLGGKGPVADSTRERVQAAAERLGYRNNALTSLVMSHLRKGTSGTVTANLGFLTGDREEFEWRNRAFYAMLYEGASARARQLGCALDPIWIRNPALRGQRLNDILRARGIHGVLVGTWIDGHTEPEIDWNHIKGVTIGYSIRTRIHRVANNQLQAMRIGLEKLSSLGYRRIGVVYEESTDERMNRNWSAAHAAWSLHISNSRRVPPLVIPTKDGLDAETFSRWYTSKQVDAVLLQGGMIRKLSTQGIRFPDDVVAASLECHREEFPVAGIDRKFDVLGAVAVDTLFTGLITGSPGLPSVPLTILVDTHWRDGFTIPVA